MSDNERPATQRHRHAITPDRTVAWLIHHRPDIQSVGLMAEVTQMAVMSA